MSNTRSSEGFYQDGAVALTNAFVATDFTFKGTTFGSTKIFLANDSAGYIEYSLDGTNVHGKLVAGEKREMPDRFLHRIYLRGQAGGEAYRLEVY